ncbi:TonB-dependent receptor domain-containing protein, partial [Prevotella histicola]|uniref:TonB-dependent receptor plug domain-containing protein n=1 Tax=Prevotella histicola TaxID=470565 RepID=UPI0028DB6C88
SSSDEWKVMKAGQVERLAITSHGYRSSIDDLGYRAAFDFRPNPRHHIRFGHDYTYHRFQPQTNSRFDSYQGEGMAKTDTIASHSHNKNVAHQLTFYAEDEMMLNEKWSLNGGVNADIFSISGKTFSTLSPRLAMKFQPNDRLSFKASYTLMSQFVHKIANSFLDLPTDYWVPTTARLHPMRSWQVAAGAYMKPNKHWLLSLEGYYKRSSHILQYSSWVGLEPPAANWDYFVMEGEGRSYGVELDADYNISNLNLHGSYTLSWAEKKFDDFYDGWYYDKFDNRHKFTFTGRWNITKKIAAFAAWTFRTGNRMTIPTQYIGLPNVPDQSAEALNFTWNSDGGLNFAYEKPNNIILPAYHRLDIGFDFRHTTKKGNERIWNLSFYNAYCHLNSMWVRVKIDDKKQMKIKNMAFIPVIPSFSYTFKF